MHVPGWHESTKELRKQGKFQTIGIIQEQHPDRCRLFMQWKGLDWPVLIDSYNLLRVEVVPITLAIDEQGIIQHIYPERESIEENFLDQIYEKSQDAPTWQTTQPDLAALKEATGQDKAEAWRAYASGLGMWGAADRLDEAIEAVHRAAALKAEDGQTQFVLGVLYRQRFDSPQRQPADFQKAVEHWERALDSDPNQYIWRRRIQQYGPRLIKPYPFYDWVPKAREQIQARGETPTALIVEPGGAEFAAPAASFESTVVEVDEPDLLERIHQDAADLVNIEIVAVPGTIRPGETTRIHLHFRPNMDHKAHWNNEVDDLAVWIDPPQGWQVNEHYFSTPNPPVDISDEARHIEFEMQAPPDLASGMKAISGYALYYVCEDVNGICLYRRQDINFQIRVESGDSQKNA